MWRSLYTVLTTYEGVYLCYLFPILYVLAITLSVIASKVKRHDSLNGQDWLAAGATLLIGMDFARYLYLFFTHTGRLLPLPYLFLKYAVGVGLWLWIFRYSYVGHFTRRAAGESFASRWTILLIICAISVGLAIVGITLSSALK